MLLVHARPCVRDDWTTVRLVAPRLSAARALMWDDVHRLARFVSQVEQDWRGWSGERVFESVEGELRISAIHDRSAHVHLDSELRESVDPVGWQLRVRVSIEAGEELTQFAACLRDLLKIGGSA